MLGILRIAWIVLVLVAAFVAGYGRVRAVDASDHERFSLWLRQLQAADVRLNERLLNARLGLLQRYDPLVECETEIQEVQQWLARVPPFVATPARAEITARLEASRRAQESKQQLIERFKTEHAILRNSVRFFPVAARDALSRARQTETAEPLAAELDALLVDVLLLNMLPERDVASRVTQRIDRALAVSQAHPTLRAQVELVLSHARVIATKKLSVDELVAQIVRSPTAVRATAIERVYAQDSQRALAADQRRTVLLFALIVLALAFGATEIIVRMERSSRALREAKTDLESANEALHHEREREREVSEGKSRLLSTLSHEFRTPLTVVSSSAEMLEAYGDRWPAEKRVEHARRILAAVRRVIQMIETILTYNRADAGLLEFKPAKTDVAALCGELVDEARAYAREGQSVVLSLEPSVDAPVAIDPRLLRHALSNLLFNGLKYSPNGGEVSLHVWIEDGALFFEVEDPGIGVAPEDLDRLFVQYYRGKNVGGIPGTGLGLALVKKAVERHGGEISVASELGHGSRFTVKIPEAT